MTFKCCKSSFWSCRGYAFCFFFFGFRQDRDGEVQMGTGRECCGDSAGLPSDVCVTLSDVCHYAESQRQVRKKPQHSIQLFSDQLKNAKAQQHGPYKPPGHLISCSLYFSEIFPYLVVIIGLENIVVVTKSVASTPVHLDVKLRVAQGKLHSLLASRSKNMVFGVFC